MILLLNSFQMIPVLLSAFGDTQNRRVSLEAAAALTQFCKAAPKVLLLANNRLSFLSDQYFYICAM